MARRVECVFIVAFGIFLSACSNIDFQRSAIDIAEEGQQRHIRNKYYEVYIPMTNRFSEINNGYFAATYYRGDWPEINDWQVSIKSSIFSCTPSTLGNRQEDIISISNVGNKAQWTFMPIFNYNDIFPEAVCTPSTAGCSDIEISDGTCKTESATYAFCSQKDSKTVFICINQQTDNPVLAKEIFETFKWLE